MGALALTCSHTLTLTPLQLMHAGKCHGLTGIQIRFFFFFFGGVVTEGGLQAASSPRSLPSGVCAAFPASIIDERRLHGGDILR